MNKPISRITSALVVLAVMAPGLALANDGTGISLHTTMNAGMQTTKIHSMSYLGTTTTVSGNSIGLTVGGTTYSVDATNAKLLRRYGAAMQVSDIQTSDILQVNGTATGTAITATQIRDLSLQQHNGTFTGAITGLSGSSFTLQSGGRGVQTINTTSATVFKNGNASSTFTALMVGQNIRVSGVWDRTNSNITANWVGIVVRRISKSGTFQSASGNTITMLGNDNITYSIDATNAKLIRHYGAAMTLGDFQSGDKISVQGSTPMATGTSFTATQVRDDSLQAHNGTFTGSVSSVNGNSFTLQSKNRSAQTVNLATLTIIRLGNVAANSSAITVGETVTVSGVWDRVNTNVTASRVTIQMKRFNVTGSIQSINGTSLVISASSTPYTIDISKARITYKGGATASTTALQISDQAQTYGTGISGSTSFMASLIRDLSRTSSGTTTP